MVSLKEQNILLSLEKVSLHYTIQKSFFRKQHHQALENISFDLYEGEILGIIGNNGAGKSTLLRLIAKTMLPMEGKITRKKNLTTSLLSLGLASFPNLSGIDNVIMHGILLGRPKKEIISCLDEIIHFAGLEDWISRPVRTYSSGMAVRLKFATALTLQADIMLIDEVFGVGDQNFKKKSAAALQEKIKTKEQTAVLVSHSLPLLEKLCTRLLWIKDARCHMIGDVSTVLEQYTTS